MMRILYMCVCVYNKIYQAPLSLAGRYKAGLAGAAGIGVVALAASTPPTTTTMVGRWGQQVVYQQQA